MRGRLTIVVIVAIIGVLLSAAVVAVAGIPEGPATPPNATNSFTLRDIYRSLNTGVTATQSTFTEPTAGPGTGTMYTLNDIYALTRNRAPVAKTGQTTSYATGDDGDLEKGVASPNPRFTDNGNGTVTDNLTKLIWLKNANCPGTPALDWNTTFTYVAELNTAGTMNSQDCGDTSMGGSHQTDWRVANLRELSSLADFAQANPALPSGNPFVGVPTSSYWTSTTTAADPLSAWGWGPANGNTGVAVKTKAGYVWPVRGGQ